MAECNCPRCHAEQVAPLVNPLGMTAREVVDHADSLTHFYGVTITPVRAAND